MFPRSLQRTFCVFWQIFLLLGFIKQPGSLLSLLTTRQINPQGRLAGPRDSGFLGSDLEAQRTSGWGSRDHRKGCLSELPRHHGFCVEPWDERLKKGKINVFFFFLFLFFFSWMTLQYYTEKRASNVITGESRSLPWGLKTLLTPAAYQIWTMHNPFCNPLIFNSLKVNCLYSKMSKRRKRRYSL